MKKLNNVFKIIEKKEKKSIVKFVNDGQKIDNIEAKDLNDFFKILSKKYIEEGNEIIFELGDEPKKENGDSEEKAFAFEFASSFKNEWNDSLENLDNIKEAKEKIIKISNDQIKKII